MNGDVAAARPTARNLSVERAVRVWGCGMTSLLSVCVFRQGTIHPQRGVEVMRILPSPGLT